MYTLDNNKIPNLTNIQAHSSSMHTIRFTSLQINKVISKLRGKSKGGPDGIPPVFVKNCSSALAMPLAYIYNKCLETSYVPHIWQTAYVTPVFKKGDTTNPQNYRPISLTCTLCKIMECVIKDNIVDFLLKTNVVTSQQHGFIKKRSTKTNLMETISDWSVALTTNSATDVIYIDFTRAFDSVVHSKLLLKLRHYGIDGNLLNWIASFLSNRTQRVVLNNCFSKSSPVLSGVVQGSVLGPVLFLVFTNDLVSACKGLCKMILFADDTKLYAVTSFDNPSIDLQLSLNFVFSWSILWQLAINILKCYFMSIHRHNPSFKPRKYYINNVEIICTDSVSDLGILMHNDLNFAPHISNIITKASQRCSAFFRGFISRDLNIVRKVFTVYIRPVLEYNTCIWNPSKIYLIDKIENIQRHFTKRIPSLKNLPYEQRLEALHLEPLELRRLRFDLCEYYAIVNNMSAISPDHLPLYDPRSSSRLVPPIIHKPTKINNTVSSQFFYRAIDCWNSLPPEIRNAPTLSSFKLNLNKYSLQKNLKGNSLR